MSQFFKSASQKSSTRSRAGLAGRMGALLMVVALGACTSGVKLDEAPVAGSGGVASGAAAGQGVAGQGVESTAVAPVQAATTDSMQPDAMARVIYFDYDSFEVRGEFTATLEANARFLKADSARRLALEGHTDERGGREYNLALGQKRAEAVRRSLALLGVSDAQMEPVSFGEEKPANFGFDEDSLSKNRRVELTYR